MTHLVFIHGPAAAGKLTVAKQLSRFTGYALFHNHLVVDAVASVFPFGTPEFVRLREAFWMAVFEAAAKQGRSLVFTFAPEPSVAHDFPMRAKGLFERHGGRVDFVRLTVEQTEQETRLVSADRAKFGKLRTVGVLRELREEFEKCEAAMPLSALTLDTTLLPPESAARLIIEKLQIARMH